MQDDTKKLSLFQDFIRIFLIRLHISTKQTLIFTSQNLFSLISACNEPDGHAGVSSGLLRLF